MRNAAFAVRYSIFIQYQLVRCPKTLIFLMFQKVSLSNPIFFPARHSDVSRAASLVVDCIDRITERRKAKANYAYVTKRDEDGFLLGIDRMEL